MDEPNHRVKDWMHDMGLKTKADVETFFIQRGIAPKPDALSILGKSEMESLIGWLGIEFDLPLAPQLGLRRRFRYCSAIFRRDPASGSPELLFEHASEDGPAVICSTGEISELMHMCEEALKEARAVERWEKECSEILRLNALSQAQKCHLHG